LSASPATLHVAAAIVRRGDTLLMVRHGATGEEPYWSIPGGVVEDGELVTEALARELEEETGLQLVDPGRIAFIVQIDNRRPVQLHESRGPGTGYLATVWTFEGGAFKGEVLPSDPDELVLEARFLPLREAISHLDRISWHALTAKYLRGELEAGTLWLQRWHPDGTVEHIASIGRSA
jgi:8-oxo-dGTP diphosphatase